MIEPRVEWRGATRAWCLGLAVLGAVSPAHAQERDNVWSPGADVRVRYAINDGWRFHPGGIEFGERPTLSDTTWARVNLPHTWNAHDPFDDQESYRRGVSWYRRTLHLADSLKGRRVFLYFEGANQVADVFVNGAFAGRHKGGYSAFALDVTRHLRFDDGRNANLVAVQVSNAHDPMLAPLSVGFALYGGIYRDVWVVATNPVHIEVTDRASSGVYVSTPSVTRERAVVSARTTVLNESAGRRDVRVVSTLVDRGGAVVSSASTTVTLAAGSRRTVRQSLPAVRTPRLWSPDDPYLYTLHTDVYDGGTHADRVTNPVGFRWFRFTPDSGFLLNGRKVALNGTNRHQDRQGLGSALSNEQHLEDLVWVKRMGANFLRLAHYPQDPAVLAAADSLGLLIWEEAPVVNYITASPEFTANSVEMVREMVRQHHNHPSVVLWGVMNEVFLWSEAGARIGRQSDTAYMRKVRDFAVTMDSVARREDPTRYSAMAMHLSGDYDLSGVSDVTQVLGLNYYSGWYSGKLEDFGTGLDNRHARKPEQILLISEYGSGSELRLNTLQPERFDHSGLYHRLFHESYLRQSRARPYLAGTAIWNQFDFSQPHIGETTPQLNKKGMLTFDRKTKDVFYMYKANWNPEPMVYIASRDWTHRAGTDDNAPTGAGPRPVRQAVDVYTNLDSVELSVNGASLGWRVPDDVRKASFDVPFAHGTSMLVALARRGAATLADTLRVRFDYYPPDLRDPAIPFRELAVNVGSLAQYNDDSTIVWREDREYAPGRYGWIGGTAKMLDRNVVITGTLKTPLYFTYRGGLEAYRADVPDGEYDVELHFLNPSGVGGVPRVFGVAVNGRTVDPRLELPARLSVSYALPIVFQTRATDGTGITVTFTPISGEPLLNAIRIRRRSR